MTEPGESNKGKKDLCGLLVSGGGSAGSTVDGGDTAEREKSGVEGARIRHSLPGHTPYPVTYLLQLDLS